MYELETGKIDYAEFDTTNVYIDEAKNYITNIIHARQQFAYLHPNRWSVTNTIYDWTQNKPTTEKAAIQAKRAEFEQRWSADERLVELAKVIKLNNEN